MSSYLQPDDVMLVSNNATLPPLYSANSTQRKSKIQTQTLQQSAGIVNRMKS
ncbi:MAG: hypothetical protein AAGA75_02115 [Cyanobacteria bacterium P01_E01_bin.6]